MWKRNINIIFVVGGLSIIGCSSGSNEKSISASSMNDPSIDGYSHISDYYGVWESECMYVSNDESDAYIKVGMNVEQDVLERRIWGYSDPECIELSDEYVTVSKAYGSINILPDTTSTQLGEAQHVDIKWFRYTWNINGDVVEIDNYFEGYEPTKDIWINQGEYLYFGMGLYLDEDGLDRPSTLQSFPLKRRDMTERQ